MVNLFIILGFADWGKTYTLRELFNRHTFFSTKSPILLEGSNKNFTIINMSNDDVGIQKYMYNFFKVRAMHNKNNINFIVTLCPVLNGGKKDCREFFRMLNSDYQIHVITLGNDWFGTLTIDRQLSSQILSIANTTKHLYCPDVINQNGNVFSNRTSRIKAYLIGHAF